MSSETYYEIIPVAVDLLRRIARKPRTREELAADLGVHERTVRRIIEALTRSGLTIETTRRGSARGPVEYRASVRL